MAWRKRAFSTVKDKIQHLRNIGVIAHIDAGKTTTTERMLYYSGYIRRIGEVDRGDTVMDYMPEERERGITIAAAAITFPWKGHRINLIDTPGHVDFTFEVERSLRVLDGCVTILDASAGVQAQTMAVWRQATKNKIPKLVFVNKMDKVGADFTRCLDDIRLNLETTPVPIQFPVEENGNLSIIDLLTSKKLVWEGSDGSVVKETAMADATFISYRQEMLEIIAQNDDEFLEIYLSSSDINSIDLESIQKALQRLTWSGKAVPVLAGASFQNIGVQPLLDAVIQYLPHPSVPFTEKLSLLAFKCSFDPQKGMLVFVRVYSGTLTPNSVLFNTGTKSKERSTKIFQVFADSFREVQELIPGSIGVLLGLKHTRTGDTLVNPDDLDMLGICLSGIESPQPVFFCSVEPTSASEEARLEVCLEIIQKEDPSIKVIRDCESGQTLLSGVGELHLEVVQNRIKKEMRVAAEFGQVQISFRETPSKITEGAVDMGLNNLKLKLEPRTTYQDLNLDNEVFLINCPSEHSSNIEVLLVNLLKRSPITNNTICRTNITLEFRNQEIFDIMATKQAIGSLYRQLLIENKMLLVEPVMSVHIECPSELAGTVINELHSKRRGNVLLLKNNDRNSKFQEIDAEVPLAELLGYSSYLRSLSQGYANLSMQPKGFRVKL